MSATYAVGVRVQSKGILSADRQRPIRTTTGRNEIEGVNERPS